jgi:hypothetical protein
VFNLIDGERPLCFDLNDGKCTSCFGYKLMEIALCAFNNMVAILLYGFNLLCSYFDCVFTSFAQRYSFYYIGVEYAPLIVRMDSIYVQQIIDCTVWHYI